MTDVADGFRQLLSDSTSDGVSLTDQAYRAIRRAVVDAVLRPGEPIAETTLAAHLGMSRTPVREALQRLRHEGLVYSIPRKGLFVSPISTKDLREIYEMVEGIESVVARLVVERASNEEIGRLREQVERMESTVEGDDRKAWHTADLAFHALLYEFARNERIRELARLSEDQTNRVAVFTLWLRPRPVASTVEHRALYEALSRRDADEAIRISHAHRARVCEEFVRLLTEQMPKHFAI